MDFTRRAANDTPQQKRVTVTGRERGSRSACASLPSPLTTPERTGRTQPGQAEPVTAQAQALRGKG